MLDGDSVDGRGFLDVSVLVAAHHVVEDGVHVLAEKVLVIVFQVEGLLVGRAGLDSVLLDFELSLESLFVALPAVLGDLGSKAVHALQLGDLLAAPALQIAVEIGLQRERNVEAARELVMEGAAAFFLGPAQLLCEMVHQFQLFSERISGKLVGVDKRGFFPVDVGRSVDECNDGPADFVGLQRFLGIFIEVVVGLDELELLVLVEEFQLIDGGKQVHSVYQFFERLEFDVALVPVDEIGAVFEDALL